MGASAFPNTHWSLVLAARGDHPDSVAALNSLCMNYWYPLYAFARRLGKTKEDAEDLTQGFFARLHSSQLLAKADQTKGRFRTFLLTCFRHCVENEYKKEQALRRGGGTTSVPIDFAQADELYLREPADLVDPAKLFSYRWAMTIIERVLSLLKNEFLADGKQAWFVEIEPFLWDKKALITQANIAARLGIAEGTVAAAVHNARSRFRELLRQEVGQTVATPSSEEIDKEIRDLFHAIRDVS
jgi:DNA-directed RNA polymerase specialized sigma24 family protein